MTITNVSNDPETLTMTIAVELGATVERAWQLWADPRQFERWWGPPTYPATVVDHDLATGGHVSFFMTGPDGDKSHSRWQVLAVEPPTRLELRDAVVDDSGTPVDGGPTAMVVTIAAHAGGSLMTIEMRFPSIEALDQAVAMDMEEVFATAIGQIEAILAEDNAP